MIQLSKPFAVVKISFDRTRQVFVLIAIVVGISSLTRLLLFFESLSSLDQSIFDFFGIFLFGFLYDLINAGYFSVPLSLYLWLVPCRLYARAWHHYVLTTLFFIFTFLLLFNAFSEWFFWNEFNARYNFIAVDYLVYTTEVIGNIEESYPIGWIIAILIPAALVFALALRKVIHKRGQMDLNFAQRSVRLGGFIIIIVVTIFFVNAQYHRFSNNAYSNELAGNGLYELFAAYRNNELSYEQFYKTMKYDEAFDLVHQLVKTPEAQIVNASSQDITRNIRPVGQELRLNVVVITVESLSANFMTAFGNSHRITPFLDSLAEQSLLFTNLYATGTRTVRGLEALSLCVPPTPGQSIVRRPGNENLFTLGSVFRAKGYESKFIYGGYGYFDNMNYFFSNNGYQVIDRVTIPKEEIDYENVWGVADENLHALALKEIDKAASANIPFFVQVLTTSNHRPFTYPEGRIDIPPHTGREGAVKYTDYAIGKFMKEASSKPWFANTLFVIVGDHCASSAGKTELPMNKYQIPMLLYAPDYVVPGKMERLMSQIDVGPTILGVLNVSYTSKFCGYDMLRLEPGRERAFISTYQKLGYIKDNRLVILSPQQRWEVKHLEHNGPETHAFTDVQLLKEAIAWYQCSSFSFKNGNMGYTNNKGK